MTRLFLVLGALFICSAAVAQNMFAPVITINGGVVTRYELDHRIAFLRILRAPGDNVAMNIEWDNEAGQWVSKWKATTVKKSLEDTVADMRVREVLTTAARDCG